MTEELPKLSDAPNTGVALTTVEVQRSDGSGGRASTDYLYAVYGTTEGAGWPRLSYRVAQVLDADDGITASTFGEEGRLDTFVETIGLRRKRDYRFLRTRDTPVVASGIGRLHVFVTSLRHPGEVPAEATTPPETFSSDRIRYATFDVPLSGVLAPRSERPVVLLDTRVPGTGGQAGAAYSRNHRGRLRWFYPNGSHLGMRSESVH